VSRVYCSDAARLRGDDNTATAARVDVWLLVEYPGTWGRDPIHDAALPQRVASALKRAVKTIPRSRLVFLRRRLEEQGGTQVYVVRSAPEVSQHRIQVPSIDDVADVPFAALSTQHAAPDTPPLVLVCTHGQHDSCCGRRGFPLYDALRVRNDLDVWQCSHIGGDRFAANAVVLPWGLYYGPVETRDADALARTILGDEIFLPGYRGRSSLSRAAQAAETFVRRATNILGRDDLHVLSRESLGAEQMRIRVAERGGTVHDVTLEQYAVQQALLTCSANETFPIPQFRLLDIKVG
jgi:hypothetical protein